MARKELGITELQWVCPKCGTLNPGPVQMCSGCGAPQPADVKFEQAARQEMVTSDEAKAKVAAGADIHCPYCGARNLAGSKICVQCGGDLVEGMKREVGRVVGSYQTGPVKKVACPHCGAENPDTAKVCSQCGGSLAPVETPVQQPAITPAPAKTNTTAMLIVIAIAVLVCGAIALVAYLSMRTEATAGTVQSVRWERSIPILALMPVTHTDWQDLIPQEAEIDQCRQEIRFVSDQPQPNSVEVCGTPYTEDTGTGYGKVVKDCEYQVYDDYCNYSVEEWQQVDVATLRGSDNSPAWPQPVLEANQELGQERNEIYTIVFDVGGKVYTYKTGDFNLFQQAQAGSQWNLNINSFGDIISIELR